MTDPSLVFPPGLAGADWALENGLCNQDGVNLGEAYYSGVLMPEE